MPIPVERVQVVKRESAAGGGDPNEDVEYNAPIDAGEDVIEAAGYAYQQGVGRDLDVMTWRDAGTLKFKDTVITAGVDLATLTAGGGLTEAAHKVLRQLIHLADGGGPFEGFASGAYCETTPAGNPFPTAVIWYTAADKAHKIVELTMTYNSNKTIATEVWKVYGAADVLLATVTDTVAYSGIFETSRTRVIA